MVTRWEMAILFRFDTDSHEFIKLLTVPLNGVSILIARPIK